MTGNTYTEGTRKQEVESGSENGRSVQGEHDYQEDNNKRIDRARDKEN